LKAKKVFLSPAQVASLLSPALAEALPADAVIANVWVNGDSTIGLLIQSDSYPNIEAGDVVYYAEVLAVNGAKVVKDATINKD